jgi:hypothetical protein
MDDKPFRVNGHAIEKRMTIKGQVSWVRMFISTNKPRLERMVEKLNKQFQPEEKQQ